MMANAPEIVLIGGGGHARVLLDALRSSGDSRSIGVLDADSERAGSFLYDVPILGNDDLLPELARSGTHIFAISVGGTRENAPRKMLFERARELGLEPLTVIHPTAIVSGWATIGAGCQILPGAIVNPGARLGANVIVNSGAIIEHDCVVGDHAHIATGACLSGGVKVGPLAHVGSGATVRQLITIGAASVVGSGAVVVKNVAPSAVVAGVPAKELLR